MPLVVGVTGGIGSGKSAAARLFEQLGAGLVDTDAIAHELTQAGEPAVTEIAHRFGAEFLDAKGALDRARMRERVFSDAASRAELEAILHPLIRQRVRHLVGLAKSPYVLVLIPLLVESGGYPDLVHRVLVIDCDEAVQIERVMARNNLTELQIRAIMRAQAGRQERLAIADDVINNSGTLDDLRRQVEVLDGRYRELAAMEEH
jgi:dephospho-CoA kinase